MFKHLDAIGEGLNKANEVWKGLCKEHYYHAYELNVKTVSSISGMDMESAWNECMETLVSFSHLLSTVNSSINFVIYCYKDDKFREILLKMLLPASRVVVHQPHTSRHHVTSQTTVLKTAIVSSHV